MKKGILIVSFGTTYKETREKNINRIVACVKEHFPEYLVYQAFSSEKIRKILSARDNEFVPGILEALGSLQKQGITHLYVLPTHIIDGIENNRLRQILQGQKERFEEIHMARVLLGDKGDYKEAVCAVWEELEIGQEDMVVFMGHGTSHKADCSYKILEETWEEVTGKKGYVATVEGSVTIDQVLGQIKQGPKPRQIILVPFMLVAGEHANKDMAGEKDSFQTYLCKEGYQTKVVLKGLGEYPGIRKIYIQHLKQILEENYGIIL